MQISATVLPQGNGAVRQSLVTNVILSEVVGCEADGNAVKEPAPSVAEGTPTSLTLCRRRFREFCRRLFCA